MGYPLPTIGVFVLFAIMIVGAIASLVVIGIKKYSAGHLDLVKWPKNLFFWLCGVAMSGRAKKINCNKKKHYQSDTVAIKH